MCTTKKATAEPFLCIYCIFYDDDDVRTKFVPFGDEHSAFACFSLKKILCSLGIT